MSNPNLERDERVSATPERIWIDPDEQTPELQFFFENSTEGFIEYVRADNAATRMRDRCVEKVREMRGQWHDSYIAADTSSKEALVRKELLFSRCQAANKIIAELESLTLEGEQEKR